jgi:hypothetical protein
MARNGSGTYQLPAGNPVVTGTTISSTVHNNTMSDIATALTGSLARNGEAPPTANLPMGGFKLTDLASGSDATDSAAYSQTYNAPATTTIASASTVNIGAALTSNIAISGTTAIAAFDSVAEGIIRTVVYTGAVPITYNATTMQLFNGASRTNAPGDASVFKSLGSGNWKEIAYIPATAAAARTSLGLDPIIGTAGSVSLRSRIINGNFDHWQEGTSFTATGYTADQFQATLSTSGAAGTVSRQAFVLGQTDVPGEPKYFFRHARTTAATALNSVIFQPIESVRTFAGKTATVSFYAKAGAAKTVRTRFVQNFGTGGTPSAQVDTYGTDITLTTAWQKYTATVALPSIAGKTLGTSANDYLGFALAEDANFSTFTIDVAQMQIEEGSVATPFEYRPDALELELCQRYYWSGTVLTNTSIGTYGYPSWLFPVRMRAQPSMTSSGNGNPTLIAFTDGGGFYQNTNGTGMGGTTTATASARL